MDQNVAAFVPLLPGYFGWNLARTKCLAGLIIALIQVRTVNFAQLATALPGGTLKDPKYKRIQRLFRTFPLDFSTVAQFPELRHFLRNPKWGPSDFGCKKSGDGHGLRRLTFVLRPSRRALRATPGLPQGLDAVSHGLAFCLRRHSHAALRRNARPYGYAGVAALRSSLTLPRFPVLLRSNPSDRVGSY